MKDGKNGTDRGRRNLGLMPDLHAVAASQLVF